MNSSIDLFREAIQAAGIAPPDVIREDGVLHRFSTNGKPDDDAGWYVYHSDGIPAGAFGDWRTAVNKTWQADIGRHLTPAEKKEHRIKVAAMQREREAEKDRRRQVAAEEAGRIWGKAASCAETPTCLTSKLLHMGRDGTKMSL